MMPKHIYCKVLECPNPGICKHEANTWDRYQDFYVRGSQPSLPWLDRYPRDLRTATDSQHARHSNSVAQATSSKHSKMQTQEVGSQYRACQKGY